MLQHERRRLESTVPTAHPLVPDETILVPGPDGVLVYESHPGEQGEELVGFAAVIDWDALADLLRKRGHGQGALYHLPEFELPPEEGSRRW